MIVSLQIFVPTHRPFLLVGGGLFLPFARLWVVLGLSRGRGSAGDALARSAGFGVRPPGDGRAPADSVAALPVVILLF